MAMVITNNSPGAGSVAWSGMVINYKGSDYNITDGNSDKMFLWWDFTSPTVLQETDTLPTMTDDDQIILTNISGTHYLTPTRTKVQAALLTGIMSAFISTPSSAPSSAYEVANKQYVDIKTPTVHTPAPGGTVTIDLSVGNNHEITMPAGNITIVVINETNGQFFVTAITQDGVGSRTATWFTTIKWAGNIVPTLTTTADKRDIFGFKCTGTDTYDGTTIGQNF